MNSKAKRFVIAVIQIFALLMFFIFLIGLYVWGNMDGPPPYVYAFQISNETDDPVLVEFNYTNRLDSFIVDKQCTFEVCKLLSGDSSISLSKEFKVFKIIRKGVYSQSDFLDEKRWSHDRKPINSRFQKYLITYNTHVSDKDFE